MTKTANVTRNSLVTYGLWGAITSNVIGQMEGHVERSREMGETTNSTSKN